MAKLAKFEDYKAPWEVDSNGDDVPEDEQQLNAAKLKKYLHGLLSDKERLQTTVTTVTEERDAARKDLDDVAAKSGTDDEKKAREQQKAIEAAKAEGGLAALKLEVALDIEGITPSQAKKVAKRLTGKDRAELEEDAKAVAEDFGIGKKDDETEDDGEQEPKGPGSRPKRPKASNDPDGDAASLPSPDDADAIARFFPRH